MTNVGNNHETCLFIINYDNRSFSSSKYLAVRMLQQNLVDDVTELINDHAIWVPIVSQATGLSDDEIYIHEVEYQPSTNVVDIVPGKLISANKLKFASRCYDDCSYYLTPKFQLL